MQCSRCKSLDRIVWMKQSKCCFSSFSFSLRVNRTRPLMSWRDRHGRRWREVSTHWGRESCAPLLKWVHVFDKISRVSDIAVLDHCYNIITTSLQHCYNLPIRLLWCLSFATPVEVAPATSWLAMNQEHHFSLWNSNKSWIYSKKSCLETYFLDSFRICI